LQNQFEIVMVTLLKTTKSRNRAFYFQKADRWQRGHNETREKNEV